VRRRPRRPSATCACGRRPAVAAGRCAALPAVGQRFDVTRLTHRSPSVVVQQRIQRRGVVYPLWISEGLATHFEFSGNERPGLDTSTSAAQRPPEGVRAGELTALRQFVVQTTVPPDAAVGRRHYAQAWGFFHFVLTERPESLRAYLQCVARNRTECRDPTLLLAEFIGALRPGRSLEPAWQDFLARQAQRP